MVLTIQLKMQEEPLLTKQQVFITLAKILWPMLLEE